MFSKEKDYFRDDLLEYTGSRQPQTGIIYGDKQPKVIICTSGGRHAEEAGYNDKEFIDGSWLYYGQGEEGDQDPTKLPNALLLERDILLFTTTEPTSEQVRLQGNYKKKYKYIGMFRVRSWGFFMPQIGHRMGNKLLQYDLFPDIPNP